MIPVMASTNIDKWRIAFAGVDSGAKIFVRPLEAGGSAAPAVIDHNKNANICNAIGLIEFFMRRIGLSLRRCSSSRKRRKAFPWAADIS
jgi:hypothetical protein